ncbi:unnamed protein product [Moneuplotes crassus]|uniref:Uncharacterized protein n=1 Tax=Euplotes crassus TaxID=5936 RepID=A0AAD2D5K9_EUPCR|nr:unnamed protein product [Moneuplotes crassus]
MESDKSSYEEFMEDGTKEIELMKTKEKIRRKRERIKHGKNRLEIPGGERTRRRSAVQRRKESNVLLGVGIEGNDEKRLSRGLIALSGLALSDTSLEYEDDSKGSYYQFGIQKSNVSLNPKFDLKNIDPDEWNNIPFPLVDCIKAILHELKLKDKAFTEQSQKFNDLSSKTEFKVNRMGSELSKIEENVDERNTRLEKNMNQVYNAQRKRLENELVKMKSRVDTFEVELNNKIKDIQLRLLRTAEQSKITPYIQEQIEQNNKIAQARVTSQLNDLSEEIDTRIERNLTVNNLVGDQMKYNSLEAFIIKIDQDIALAQENMETLNQSIENGQKDIKEFLKKHLRVVKKDFVESLNEEITQSEIKLKESITGKLQEEINTINSKFEQSIVELKNVSSVDEGTFNRAIQSIQEKSQKYQEMVESQISKADEDHHNALSQIQNNDSLLSNIKNDFDKFTQEFEKYKQDIAQKIIRVEENSQEIVESHKNSMKTSLKVTPVQEFESKNGTSPTQKNYKTLDNTMGDASPLPQVLEDPPNSIMSSFPKELVQNSQENSRMSEILQHNPKICSDTPLNQELATSEFSAAKKTRQVGLKEFGPVKKRLEEMVKKVELIKFQVRENSREIEFNRHKIFTLLKTGRNSPRLKETLNSTKNVQKVSQGVTAITSKNIGGLLSKIHSPAGVRKISKVVKMKTQAGNRIEKSERASSLSKRAIKIKSSFKQDTSHNNESSFFSESAQDEEKDIVKESFDKTDSMCDQNLMLDPHQSEHRRNKSISEGYTKMANNKNKYRTQLELKEFINNKDAMHKQANSNQRRKIKLDIPNMSNNQDKHIKKRDRNTSDLSLPKVSMKSKMRVTPSHMKPFKVSYENLYLSSDIGKNRTDLTFMDKSSI